MNMVTEENIVWNNGSDKIEGMLGMQEGENAVVICHPHPLMGGSMHNNVVEAMRDAFALHNFTTLRFNFRGVGASTGKYDEGRGEQTDILSAHEFLKKRGAGKIFLAGYSFGAWVGASVLEKDDHLFAGTVLISPPFNYFNFSLHNLKNKIDLLVCGDHDQFCDAAVLRKQAKEINSVIEIINETDHFYSGKEKSLIDILIKYFDKKVK